MPPSTRADDFSCAVMDPTVHRAAWQAGGRIRGRAWVVHARGTLGDEPAEFSVIPHALKVIVGPEYVAEPQG